MLDLSFWTPE